MLLSEVDNGTNAYKSAILAETREMIQSFDAETKSRAARDITDKLNNPIFSELKRVFDSWN